MATDRQAVIWTACGGTPRRMGALTVTDTQCRFTYDPAFLDSGLPGLSLLYPPGLIGTRTIPWERSAWFDLFPPLQSLVPPASEANFQRRLVLAWLEKQGRKPAPGFDSDWAILMTAGHGGIGHLDVFTDDAQATGWYANDTDRPLQTIEASLGFSLKEFLTWFDHDAGGILGALGPTPTVGGAIPKLLLAIPATGWDGRVGLPRRGRNTPDQTDVVLKFERSHYPGMVELEALALEVHKAAGFAVPRYWVTTVNDIPAIAIERFDRTPEGRSLCTETLYSLMAIGDRRIDNHYSGRYDDIARALERSPIALVSDPAAAKRHLVQRLLLAMLTGNGDLHLENLSLLQDGTQTAFSPVYDPTPMRAYSLHNELCAMPFGDYGDYDERERLVDYDTAMERFRKRLGYTPGQFRELAEAMVSVTAGYPGQLEGLRTLPDPNRRNLIRIVEQERARMTRFLAS
ncbi:MAG: type II toxin-antitoxin system HipA family toxin [Gammaproteobacteria bacterium]|nr:type II toxin-antitoxin system HipA family toxin [Gammaproteobacteria bacterium]